MDVYDAEFNSNLLLAKELIAKMGRRRDRDICSKWIKKLCLLKSNNPVVKKNRNQFFKYMLTIIQKGISERQPASEHCLPQYDKYTIEGSDWLQSKGFMSRWSADKKTYVAAKPLPGKGALVYMAVSKDPTLGWERARM